MGWRSSTILPLGVGEEHRPRLVHEEDAHLAHARVGAHGLLVHRAEEGQLRLRPDVLPARLHRVARGQASRRAEADRRRPRGAGRDGGRGLRREPQALGRQVLGEAVAGLVALDHPHAHAEVDVGERAVDRSVLQHVGVPHLVLEEDVGEIAAAREGLAERRLDQLLRDPEAAEVPDPGGRTGAGRGQGPRGAGQDVVSGDRAYGGGAQAHGLATGHSAVLRHARTSRGTVGMETAGGRTQGLRRGQRPGSFINYLDGRSGGSTSSRGPVPGLPAAESTATAPSSTGRPPSRRAR